MFSEHQHVLNSLILCIITSLCNQIILLSTFNISSSWQLKWAQQTWSQVWRHGWSWAAEDNWVCFQESGLSCRCNYISMMPLWAKITSVSHPDRSPSISALILIVWCPGRLEQILSVKYQLYASYQTLKTLSLILSSPRGLYSCTHFTDEEWLVQNSFKTYPRNLIHLGSIIYWQCKESQYILL